MRIWQTQASAVLGHSLPRSHRSHAEAAAWGRGWWGGSEPRRWKALGGVARTDVDDRLQRACAPARAGSGSCGLYSDALAAASRRFLRRPPVCQWREPARVDRGMGSAALAWQQAHHASEFAAEELCSARAVRPPPPADRSYTRCFGSWGRLHGEAYRRCKQPFALKQGFIFSPWFLCSY